ncbi:MAG: LptF/LptG family permease [Caulobacteraceae bacterium]
MTIFARRDGSKAGGGMGVRLIDRYVLRMSAKPMLGCLGVTLVALLLERALRIFDLLAQSSARFGYVFELTANLVPHYLGLALPASFFIAIFLVVTRLSDGSEIDALMAGGVSLARLAAPFVALGVVLTLFSLILSGYLQPYTRYTFRAAMRAAEAAGWNGRLAAQSFVSAGEGVTLTADDADPTGRRLWRVFVRRTLKDGREEITTARTAELRRVTKGGAVQLVLEHGERLTESAKGQYGITRFDQHVVEAPLAGAAVALKARGGDERELTLDELWGEMRHGDGPIRRETYAAEFYTRIMRAVTLPLLPLLGLPLGLASKRGRRSSGVIIAGLVLVGFQHSLQFAQSLAAGGHAAPEGVLLVGSGFAVLCGSIFWGSRERPGDTPVSRGVEQLAIGLERLIGLVLQRQARLPA